MILVKRFAPFHCGQSSFSFLAGVAMRASFHRNRACNDQLKKYLESSRTFVSSTKYAAYQNFNTKKKDKLGPHTIDAALAIT